MLATRLIFYLTFISCRTTAKGSGAFFRLEINYNSILLIDNAKGKCLEAPTRRCVAQEFIVEPDSELFSQLLNSVGTNNVEVDNDRSYVKSEEVPS
jgi:hypothetical protein